MLSLLTAIEMFILDAFYNREWEGINQHRKNYILEQGMGRNKSTQEKLCTIFFEVKTVDYNINQ